MNKFLAGILLASAVVPATAQAQDWDRNRDRDHREWSDDRGRDDHRDHDDRRGNYDGRGYDRRGNYGQNDWRGWRDRNPGEYRRGNWRAPFAYRTFGVGAVVPRDYWGSRYYVNDYARYRLPQPGYGYYRYVRHYDDVLLINLRNGRVVQIYRGFYR